MFDCIQEVRFPTVGELITALPRGPERNHMEFIMCTDEGTPTLAVIPEGRNSVVSTTKEFERDSIYPCCNFYPAFVVKEKYRGLLEPGKRYTPASVFGGRGRAPFFNEPLKFERSRAVYLDSGVLIAMEPALKSACWLDGEHMTGQVKQHKFVVCPFCGTLHFVDDLASRNTYPLRLRCSRCNDDFYVSEASHLGLSTYASLNEDQSPLTSVGIDIPMQNGGMANIVLGGGPACLGETDFFEVGIGDASPYSSLYEMFCGLHGTGWNVVDVDNLADRIRQTWTNVDERDIQNICTTLLEGH